MELGIRAMQPWSNPVDRKAHGGVPFIEYYLQQFKLRDQTTTARACWITLTCTPILPASTTATAWGCSHRWGHTGAGGAARTRRASSGIPTYTDPNYPQPNYTTDSNYTASCNVPLQAPQVIPMMQTWVASGLSRHQDGHYRVQLGRAGAHQRRSWRRPISLASSAETGSILATLWGPPDPQRRFRA